MCCSVSVSAFTYTWHAFLYRYISNKIGLYVTQCVIYLIQWKKANYSDEGNELETVVPTSGDHCVSCLGG